MPSYQVDLLDVAGGVLHLAEEPLRLLDLMLKLLVRLIKQRTRQVPY